MSLGRQYSVIEAVENRNELATASAVVIEDHVMFRELLCKCAVALNIEVLRQAENARTGIAACREVRPDLVILDLGLPDMDGLEVIRATRAYFGDAAIRFLVVTGHCDPYTFYLADEIGVQGFASKAEEGVSGLRCAIARVSAGGTYYCDAFIRARTERRMDHRFFGKLLSKREQHILGLIALGLSDHEVARAAGIASSTAQTHRKHISHKLGISGTPKLISFAQTAGFTSLLRPQRSAPPHSVRPAGLA